MDSWSADQLRKMQLGGNGNVNAFLQQYGIPKATDIRVKYNSRAAELYREKLKADLEGRQFVPPPPSAIPPPTSNGAAAGARGASAGSARGAAANDDWDSWGDAPAAPNGRQGGAPHSAGAGRGGAGNEYSRSQYEASAAAKEGFFARKMAENSSRPEGLPPSQARMQTHLCR